MANIASAKKSIRKTIKQTARNNSIRSEVKTHHRRLQEGLKAKQDVKQVAIDYISALDKAVKKGVVHANKACRHKSILSKYIYGTFVAPSAEVSVEAVEGTKVKQKASDSKPKVAKAKSAKAKS